MRPFTRSSPLDEGARGQALVEFSLVIPVFLLIVFSVVQFGMLLGGQDALDNSVREATRYAATVPVSNTTDAGSCAAGVGANVYARLQTVLSQKVPGYAAANLVACGDPAPATTVSYCIRANADNTPTISTDDTYSIWVQITAVYRHPLFIPLVGMIVDQFDGAADSHLRATATEQMRVETFSLSGPYLGGFSTCTT